MHYANNISTIIFKHGITYISFCDDYWIEFTVKFSI